MNELKKPGKNPHWISKQISINKILICNKTKLKKEYHKSFNAFCNQKLRRNYSDESNVSLTADIILSYLQNIMFDAQRYTFAIFRIFLSDFQIWNFYKCDLLIHEGNCQNSSRLKMLRGTVVSQTSHSIGTWCAELGRSILELDCEEGSWNPSSSAPSPAAATAAATRLFLG